MIYAEDDVLAGTDYLIGRAAYEANFADQFDLQVFVHEGRRRDPATRPGRPSTR